MYIDRAKSPCGIIEFGRWYRMRVQFFGAIISHSKQVGRWYDKNNYKGGQIAATRNHFITGTRRYVFVPTWNDSLKLHTGHWTSTTAPFHFQKFTCPLYYYRRFFFHFSRSYAEFCLRPSSQWTVDRPRTTSKVWKATEPMEFICKHCVLNPY